MTTTESKNETISHFIDVQKRLTQDVIKAQGFLNPAFFVLIRRKDTNENGVAVVEIPPFMMELPRTILLAYFKTVKEQMSEENDIYSVCFASEAWVRNVPKDFDLEDKEAYAQVPKKEVLIILFSNEDGDKIFVYDIIRKDEKAVNVTGDIVDFIELEEGTDMDGKLGGELSNLYHL